MKKFIMSVALAISILFLPSTSQAYLLDGVQQFNGHYYKIFNYCMTWEEAKNFCEEIGGHIVTITSQDEQNFIMQLLSNYGGKNCYWIGCKLNFANKMEWITKEPMNYSHWASYEPDNHQGNQGYGYMAGKNINNDTPFGIWGDIQNDGEVNLLRLRNFGLICEWDYSRAMKVQNR